MDLTSIAVTSIVSVIFTSIGAGISLLLLKRRLKRALWNEIRSGIADLVKNKDNPAFLKEIEPIETFIQMETGKMISDLVEGFKNDPKGMASMFKPAIDAIIAEYMPVGLTGGQNGLLEGAGGLSLPFLPKKYQGLAQLAIQFMTKGKPVESGTSGTPFK